MRLHAMSWKTVYHHETLVHGLAPEDLGTMLTQRLRWAQGSRLSGRSAAPFSSGCSRS
jgi:cellulose synthase (UDP-forming)